MIWEGYPMESAVQKLDGLGVRSAVLDPCGTVPDTGDFLSVMQQNAKALEPVFVP
jgi:zinc transport system substrate-binding protein